MAAAPAGHRATWQSLLWTGVALGLLQPRSVLSGVAPEQRPTVVFASLPPAALPLVFAVAQVADVNVQLMDSSPVTHRHISADRNHSLCLSTLGCRIDETIQQYISAQLPQAADVEVVCPTSVCRRESTIWLLTGQPAVDPQVYDEVVKVAYLASSEVVQPIAHTTGHGGGPQIWPICIENGIGWVGPAEAERLDGCHYCHWLRRTAQNPRWAAHLIQAINGNPPSVDSVLPMMTSVVAYAVVAHTMLVDGQPSPVWAAMPGPHQAVRVCSTPTAYVDVVDSAPHPQCQCSSRNVGHTCAAHMAQVG